MEIIENNLKKTCRYSLHNKQPVIERLIRHRAYTDVKWIKAIKRYDLLA